MDRSRQKSARRHNDPSAASSMARSDRPTKALRAVRPTVADGTESREIEIAIGEDRRFDARQYLRHFARPNLFDINAGKICNLKRPDERSASKIGSYAACG
jgi:hypothetical protein